MLAFPVKGLKKKFLMQEKYLRRDLHPEYKNKCYNSTVKRQNEQKNPLQWGKRFEQMFLQRDLRMTNEYMERCLTSLALRKMQIKTKIHTH